MLFLVFTIGMIFVFGLGNIGEKYSGTRHNVGFAALDMYAQKYGADFAEEKMFFGSIAKLARMTLVKPSTFMNESGKCAKKLIRTNTDIPVIVYDDIDIPLGTLKCSFGKNAGGHNGVQSIIDHLGTKDFFRIRIGVRPVHEEMQKFILPPNGFEHFLLSDFAPQEKELLEQGIEKALQVIGDIPKKSVEELMNIYNS